MTAAPPTTLADFLLARIAEDEAALVEWCWRYNAGNVTSERRAHPLNVVRQFDECEAKRQLIGVATDLDNVEACAGYSLPESETLGYPVLFALAQAYAEHPDFRPEWRPESRQPARPAV